MILPKNGRLMEDANRPGAAAAQTQN
jgi:hypothetical protein